MPVRVLPVVADVLNVVVPRKLLLELGYRLVVDIDLLFAQFYSAELMAALGEHEPFHRVAGKCVKYASLWHAEPVSQDFGKGRVENADGAAGLSK